MELLRMINGKTVPTKAVIAGLSKELDSDLRYLTKLAAEIKPQCIQTRRENQSLRKGTSACR
jgi:hypothetical protein